VPDVRLDRFLQCDYKNHMGRPLRKTVGARELKTRLGGYLRAVRSGAILLVTDRGEPVAELRPVPRASGDLDSRLNELAALGLLSRGSGEPLPEFDPGRGAGSGRAASDVVRADREDRF
jgi:prevent-host-death family protein